MLAKLYLKICKNSSKIDKKKKKKKTRKRKKSKTKGTPLRGIPKTYYKIKYNPSLKTSVGT